MSNGTGGFELEPEKEDPQDKELEGRKERAKEQAEKAEQRRADKRDAQAGDTGTRAEPRSPSALTYAERAAERANRRIEDGADASHVDARTLAERKGEEIPRGHEDVGPPPDYPTEAFTFPLRKPGPAFLLAGIVTLLPLDVLGAVGAVAFFAWLLKLLLVAFVLRAQICIIGSSAAGHDAPTGWARALSFDQSDLWPYARTLLGFVCLLAPGYFVLVFGNMWLGLLLLVLGSMYAAVIALASALQDPGLIWPWRALGWIARNPVSCLAGSAGWWVFFLAEWSLASLQQPALPLVGFLSLVLRAACFYALVVSARAIGVMGRSWSAD